MNLMGPWGVPINSLPKECAPHCFGYSDHLDATDTAVGFARFLLKMAIIVDLPVKNGDCP
jgi:hypothetical protein